MGPALRAGGLSLSLDHTPGMTAVRLDCDRAVPGPRSLVRDGDRWRITLPPAGLDRLEYRFEVTWGHRVARILDPGNPRIVPGVFGPRSLALRPGYEPPSFVRAPDGGTFDPFPVPGRGAVSIPVTVWSPEGLPADTPAPLLLVNDGPEYAQYAALTRFAAQHCRAGTLPAHRLALLHPERRDDWYSGSPDYLDTVTGALLDTLTQRYAVRHPIAVMGASLGGLTALLIARAEARGAGRIGAVFAQSGSFFTGTSDAQERAYRYFPRVAAYVDVVSRLPAGPVPLRVSMTCGALEENVTNNRAMADLLSRAGHTLSYREVRDLHNYSAWRDSLEPGLVDLLRETWRGGFAAKPARRTAAH